MSVLSLNLADIERADSVANGRAHSVAATRLHFFGLCCYLLAQSCMIPFAPVGSSWTLWPTLADVAVLVLCFACVWRFPTLSSLPAPHRRILAWLVVVIALCVSSFAASGILLPRLNALRPPTNTQLLWGGYEIVRLGQFFLVFFTASAIPLTTRRLRILLNVVTISLLVACSSVLLTYLSIIPHEALVAHLPKNPDICGPWIKYYHTPDGLGTLSYNHGDAACLILMLFAVRLHLSSNNFGALNAVLLVVTLAAIFATGSRTNLLAMLMYGAIFGWQMLNAAQFKWMLAVATVVLSGVLLLSLSGSHLSRKLLQEHRQLVERNVVVLVTNRTGGFAGRTGIWEHRIRFLNEEPIRWAVGSGFGSAAASGSQSHNLFLNIVLETGVIGLIGAGLLMHQLLRLLWRGDQRHTIFWVTIVLLFTCMTREAFYPVPHTAHFVGFFLAAIAIALRSAIDPVKYDPPHEPAMQ